MGESSSGEWSPGGIPYQALADATDNFSEERFLGKGGFGPVYRAFLSDWGREVAVKKLRHMSDKGMKQYASEVKIITQVRHPNLVKLLGWCEDQGDLMLIYEFMPHGSLDAHLFRGRSLLTWAVRYKIVLGLANALMSLHDECKVLHRDIKSSNVLLDSNFDAKLGDFGLAMLFNHDMSSTQVSHPAGTRGYWAPEYALAAKASKKSDVYSFGVVVLEIACGKKAIRTVMAIGEDGESCSTLLVEWVWDLYGKGTVLEAVDERLNGDFVRQEVELLLTVGLWCAHPDRQRRPSMSQAVDALLHTETARVPDLPAKMPPWAYTAATGQMGMVQDLQVSSSSSLPPVSGSSPRHGSSPSPSRHSGRAADGLEPSSNSSSRSHRVPKRSIFERFAWWKRPSELRNGGKVRVTGNSVRERFRVDAGNNIQQSGQKEDLVLNSKESNQPEINGKKSERLESKDSLCCVNIPRYSSVEPSLAMDWLEISWDEFLIKERISAGSFRTLHRAECHGSDAAVMVLTDQDFHEDQMKEFPREDNGEPKEWMAQLEPGVHITFISLPGGGNDLKHIRFSREMFNNSQAQRWCGEHHDRIIKLYNVQRFSRQALPTPPRSEDERDSPYTRVGSTRESPVAPPLGRDRLAQNASRATTSGTTNGEGVLLPVPDPTEHLLHQYGSGCPPPVPRAGQRGETSSLDASRTTTSSRDEAPVSISNGSDQKTTEWVDRFQSGVYVTIRQMPDGARELLRVRFSRRRFSEQQAETWWDENRDRTYAHYNIKI